MIITALKQQVKQAHRVSVFVDGTYSFSLTLDQLLEEKLKKGDLLDESRVKQLKKLSDEGKLKQRALEWVLMRPHAIREFREYLYRKKIDKDLGDVWIEEFTTKKYLDDESFAHWFADNRVRKNKSARAIQAELRSKGISQEAIQSVQLESEQTDSAALQALVIKLRRRPRYMDDQKLMQYLASKGFSYGLIKEAVASKKDI